MPGREPRPTIRPGTYDSLIDAERTALLQAGRKPTRHDLTAALVEATGLAARDARRMVARYIEDRGGFVPTTTPDQASRTGWIDGLLDAERADAARDDRPVTPRTLLRAVRQAAPHLSRRQARAALDDYLHRRAGRSPRRTGRRVAALLLALLIALVVAVWACRPA